jgi:recombination protein RecA
MKIGVMFGNPETTTGGNALKFYASVRIEVRKIESLSRGADDIIGNRIRIKVVKNKVSPPFKKVELDLMFGEGISYISSVLDAALKYEMLEKSGSWYSYNGEKIGQGRDKTLDFLKDNPDIVADLDVRLRAQMFPKKVKDSKTEKSDPENQ